MRRSVAGVLLLVLTSGCENRDTRSELTLRDSVGVRIMEYGGRAEAAAPTWRIDPTPTLDLGGTMSRNGPALYRIAEVLRLEDGRIVVANGGSNSLEVFAPDGTRLRSVGRSGDGPGEFRALSWVGRLKGDTLAAWDSGLGRLSLFSSSGDYVRSVSPRRPLGMYPQAVGALASGDIVLALYQPTLGKSTTRTVHLQRDTVGYAVLSRDGSARELGKVAGTDMIMSGNPAGGLMVMPLPFGRQSVATVGGERVYVTDGEQFEVAAYDARGGVRALLRAEWPRLPVTSEDVRRFRESLVTLGGEGNASLQRQQAELLDRAPWPQQKPAITSLRTDPGGNLWVESPVDGPERLATRWTAFSPQGRVLGAARVPGRLDVRQVGPNWVLGIALDQNQVEHVRLHKLIKPE